MYLSQALDTDAANPQNAGWQMLAAADAPSSQKGSSISIMSLWKKPLKNKPVLEHVLTVRKTWAMLD